MNSFRWITVILFLLNLIFIDCFQNDPSVPLSTLATCQDYYVESKECHHYFPIESLKNYPSDSFKVHVKFYVMATYEVNIVMTDHLKDPKLEYRAVIGAKLNTNSYLKKMNVENHPESFNSKQLLLHPIWPTPVVVQQTICGDIVVSIPGVAEPLLTLNAAELNLNYICLFAWDNKSRWFYNCDEEEDNLMYNITGCTKFNPSPHKLDIRTPITQKN